MQILLDSIQVVLNITEKQSHLRADQQGCQKQNKNKTGICHFSLLHSHHFDVTQRSPQRTLLLFGGSVV